MSHNYYPRLFLTVTIIVILLVFNTAYSQRSVVRAKKFFIEKKYDAVINELEGLPQSAYKELKSSLTLSSFTDSVVYPAYALTIQEGYFKVVWIVPIDTSHEFREKVFGLSTFSPITAYILTNTSEQDINNISPSTFIEGVKNDQLFLTNSFTTGLSYSTIPELSNTISYLKTRGDLFIAGARDSIIFKILDLRRKYLIANLRYIITKFEIPGKCFISPKNYDVNTSVLSVHLSIDLDSYGIYVATVKSQVSLNYAQSFFTPEMEDGYFSPVKFQVLPGFERKSLGIYGWRMPNLYITRDIGLKLDNSQGKISKIKTMNFTGELWPPEIYLDRWDLTNIKEPYAKYKCIRIISGKIVPMVKEQAIQDSLMAIQKNVAASNLKLDMVFIEGGTFQMGSNDDESNENPVHSVILSGFFIGKYEVTQKQWRDINGNNPSKFINCDNCPVEQVSWNDVQEFIQKLNQKTGKNYRLPTEAEWEYAARGGNKSSGYTYSGSNSVGDVAWYTDNSGSKTQQVGQKQQNELGLFDMSGNVWEWCSDWYGADYYQNSSTSNPKGPSSGSTRVGRGGCWYFDGQRCRTSNRSGNGPGYSYDNMGFRLVLVP